MTGTTSTFNNILNFNFGSRVYSTPALPANVYFGLSTTIIDDTGLATVEEPVDAEYARVVYPNTQWTSSVSGTLSNTVAIAFPKTDIVEETILSVFIADVTPIGMGIVLWYCTLDPSLTIGNNTVVTFPIGSITITW
jgi:hypothetical protein